MKQWTKRRISLILVLAMLLSLLTGCFGNDQPDPTVDNAAGTEGTDSTESTTAPTTAPTEPMDWLAETIDSIHQSLLGKDYAQAVKLLLDGPAYLVDDATYNALLYIAYMANKNADAALALLKNPDLNTDAFTDAFLESMDALKENEELAELHKQLAAHMLELGKDNPKAYAAAAKIGAKVQNDNPEDPTAYVLRYIAAIAADDEAGAKAVLNEAKANGISVESLKNTAINYVDEYDVTAVTVEEIKKGKKITTTYNGDGDVIKSEVVVDNKDGTETLQIFNSDGKLLSEVLRNKNTKVVSKRTDYGIVRTEDEETGEITETLTGMREIYLYEKGVLKSLYLYDAKGNEVAKLSLDAKGNVTAGYEYVNGKKVDYSKDILSLYSFKTKEKTGELMFRSMPLKAKDGKPNGKEETTFDYMHAAGVPRVITRYTADGNGKFTKYLSIDAVWYFNGNAKGHEKVSVVTYYTNGLRVKESTFQYAKDGKMEKYTSLTYDAASQALTKKVVTDFKNGKDYQTFTWEYGTDSKEFTKYTFVDYEQCIGRVIHKAEKELRDSVLDKDYHEIKTTVYSVLNQNKVWTDNWADYTDEEKVLREKWEYTYENGVFAGGYGECYDELGRVTEEATFGTDKENPIQYVWYDYTTVNDVILKTTEDYVQNTRSDDTLDAATNLPLIEVKYTGTRNDVVLNRELYYYYKGTNCIGGLAVFYNEAGQVVAESYFDFVGEDGQLNKNQPSRQVRKTYDAAGNMTKQTDKSYNVNGEVTSDLTTEYSYDSNGRMTGRTEKGYDAYGAIASVYKEYYDEKGNNTKTELYDEGAAEPWLISESAYDASGRVVYNIVYYSFSGMTMLAEEYEYSYQNSVKTVVKKDGEGNLVYTEVTKNVYDNLSYKIGYMVTTTYANGSAGTVYYTVDGYRYQPKIVK